MKGVRTVCEHHVDTDGVQRPGCGAPIVLVLVVPEHPKPGSKRRHIPLDATYDPACGLPPSHAVSTGGTTCRPLAPGDTPAPHEDPAITHFATCPHRRNTP